MFNVNENKKLLFVLRNSARLKLTEKRGKSCLCYSTEVNVTMYRLKWKENNNKTVKKLCCPMIQRFHASSAIVLENVDASFFNPSQLDTASSSSLRIPILTFRLVSCDKLRKSGKRPMRK